MNVGPFSRSLTPTGDQYFRLLDPYNVLELFAARFHPNNSNQELLKGRIIKPSRDRWLNSPE